MVTSVEVSAETVVIANHNNETDSLTNRQLVDLYMGRDQNFPNGEAALPLDHVANSSTRASFYKGLVNKSVAEVNAYWARLLFTGRASPPRVMQNTESIMKTVRENSGAIGYIDSQFLDESVKVLSRVN